MYTLSYTFNPEINSAECTVMLLNQASRKLDSFEFNLMRASLLFVASRAHVMSLVQGV